VFDIRFQTMTESTSKILILDWKTPGIFHPKECEPCPMSTSAVLYTMHLHEASKTAERTPAKAVLCVFQNCIWDFIVQRYIHLQ